MRLAFDIPLRTGQGLNARMHWADRAKQVERERRMTTYRFPVLDLVPAVIVTMTRLGPRELDSDNLQGSLKGVRDAIASKLRLDDSCRLVEWRYAQEKAATHSIRVEIEAGTKGEAT